MSRRRGELGHLARRFVDHARSAVRPRRPGPAEEAWARSWLSEPEAELWASQAVVDRAHSIAVAEAVAVAVAAHTAARCTVAGPAPTAPGPQPAPERWVMAAALLHDVGKADAHLGLIGRTTATVLELAHVGWAPARLGRYLRYPEEGARRLAAAGSDHRVVAWAREHHRSPAARSGAVPATTADLLADADRLAVPARSKAGLPPGRGGAGTVRRGGTVR